MLTYMRLRPATRGGGEAARRSGANRDETKEWERIRELQRKKAARLFGGGFKPIKERF
jgi:hypothetical protein